MSNELIKQQIPITEIMSIGKAFVESGMFPDVKSVAQAAVKIQAGQELGIPPFAAMNGIYIIAGRATVGAGIIAAKIKGSGKYDYRVVDHTDKVCSIDILQTVNNPAVTMDKIGNSTFTIDDAKKAGTKNMDKHPKNMLFARAISNAVKWFCPDVFNQAVYTPEEMEGVTEDIKHEEVKEPAADKTPHIQEIINGNGHDNTTKGTATKPLISNIQFSQLCDRVKKGDTKAYWAGVEMFTFLDQTQRNILDDYFNELKNPGNNLKAAS